MLINHLILLLLSCRYARAIDDEKHDDVIDQIASENQRVPVNGAEVPPISTENPATPSTLRVPAIHYENSNGFIPMTMMNERLAESPDIPEIFTTTSDDIDDQTIGTISRESDLLEDDPAYSTEARMFLNLAGPRADRRSFDTQDAQSEFEILKVNNETPAIANYHDFYENMRNNLNRNGPGTQTRHDESREPARTASMQNKRTKDRIKKIEKYLTNFYGNEDRDNRDNQQRYDDVYSTRNSRPAPKDIFEPEKVQSAFNQKSVGQTYDEYRETPQRTSSILRSSHDNPVASSRQKHPAASSKNRHSKPVIVIEPSDYKVDMKYGTEQVSAKFSSLDHHETRGQRKDQPEVERASKYDAESRVNREDRYGQSYERSEDNGDYPEEDEYHEVTEKPRRIHKSRRRPYSTENSHRLPKEHRGHVTDNPELDDSRKSPSPSRSKLHRPKAKPGYWIDDDRSPASDETSVEQPDVRTSHATSKPQTKNPSQTSNSKGVANWSQVGPNIEVSHSNGFEIGQIDKPKLLVPVNLNLLPLTNFDRSTPLGNGQSFDFTNIPNFVTAAPIVSSQAPQLNAGQTIVNNAHVNPIDTAKNNQNSLANNYGLSTAVPDIIVGQNTYQNPIRTVLLPQMNIQNKFTSNLRSHYLPSTVAPMYTMTQNLNSNLANIAPTMTSIPFQNFPSTSSPGNVNSMSQNFHNVHVNPSVSAGVQQLLLPQPTLQSFPLLHGPFNANANYNIVVDPNGLHGQNSIQHGAANGQAGTLQNSASSTSTPQLNTLTNNNYHSAENQVRKNTASNSNGQFVTTASFAVGNEEQTGQSNTLNDNKYYLGTNNQNHGNDNNNYYNGNQNNQQVSRPQQQENFYQIYRDDQNSNGQTYVQTGQVVPAIIHHGNAIPLNFNNQNYANIGGQLQEQQSMLNPSVVAHRPGGDNQQILKAANDIFENTWKQLQQLQSNEDTGRRLPHQTYRINDNLGSTSNANGNTINVLNGFNVNPAKAHLPILSTQNVEILNPNIKPSPVDLSLVNPYETLNRYPAAILTTPIPIFSTTASFLVPRPIIAGTSGGSMNLQNYVDQLTQIGAQSNQVNKFEQRPRNPENQRQVFNPINFVPSVDLMKSQSMLNSKHTETLPNQLNLVPLIPGGNFFKNTQTAQNELVQKPRLSSDLEKYAEEMFKESLKTIYSSHRWNNDRKLRGNYSSAELNDLARLKSELASFKASMSDPKYAGKDILEAHNSETKIRTAEPSSSSRPTKKPELTIAEIEQLFKSDFKLNLPSSTDSPNHGSHQKTRQGHSRPGPGGERSTEFRNIKQLSDYLTPPKLNSFVSKSPFVDAPKSGKKRPGSGSPRYSSGNGKTRITPRPSSLVSRLASGPDAAGSSHVESGIKSDAHRHNYEAKSHANDPTDYRNYPSFTTTLPPDDDPFGHYSGVRSFKTDYYDINHPRMHNLLGLLMKNQQLPKGSSQSFFRDEDDLRRYFDTERRRMNSEFYDETARSIEKKSDTPLNMGPPAPPNHSQLHYYSPRGAA